jgi:hypothetical protein
MQIKLPLVTDSYNSYPTDNLLVTLGPNGDATVLLQIEGYDRKIEVNGRDLLNVLKLRYE